MSSDPQRVQSVFLAAVEAPPPERAALIDRECGEDHLLRRRVETLLKAHDEPGDFLGSRHSEIEPTIDTRLCEGPGTIIGQYKLMEEVGDGGMGVVFVAEQQEPVRRKVALKIIKPGMGSKEVISRFEAERQALALMDHPNIARVLDAGTTDSGLPYFVMELVRGIPICDYCDANNLSTGERLDLFLPICHAIQHAHQKGIVHRDIKPSNVMVTLHDGVAVPKVIDFGVAKAISQRLTERTVYTRYAQMIGTPLYMSPEQAELSGLDIDTRSDVYSLGVLLYELLTGTTPFDKKRLCEAAYDELLRIIREEEPPKPSTRISSLGDTAVAVSAHRRTEPKRLGQLLHGDLDWIVMTALEKDRTRRYETANGFAADIKRYLDDEPVLARPPSAVYRFRKFARRNKAVMTTVSLVAASLVLGVIVSSWLAIRANVQHDRAVTAERVARQEAQRAVAAEQTANRERNSARDAERRAQEQRNETRRLLYPAEMIAVQQAWSAGDLAGAMKVLERHVPQENEEDLRGFYWTCLRRLCDRSLARKPMQYPERISSVALSPDGKLVAATSSVYANLVYMWEVATGDRVGPELEGQAVACSPNETTFAIRDGSGIRLWNPGTGTRKSILPYSGGPVRVLAFSGDGSRLATGGFNKKVHVWNLSEGGKPRVFEGPEWVVFSVALSPDGRWVAAVAPPQLFLWDVEGDGQPIVLEQDVDSASCVAFANDGTTLASGGWDGRIKLWDIETRRQKGVLRTRNVAVIYSLASSSDGRLAAGAEDGSVTVWSLDDREQIDVLKGHQHTVWAVAFSSDNRTLASGSMDGEVRTWDVANRRPPDGLKHPTQQFTGVAFSPDGSVVATASTDHVVMLWDAQTGEQLQALPAHRASIYDIAFSPSGDWLAAVSSFDETIRVWDLALGTDRALLKQFLPLAVAFSPDGQTIAVGGAGAQLHLWDHATGTRGLECKGHHNAQIRALAISPDGQIVASGSWDRNIVLWEASTGRYVVTLKGHDRDVRCLAFSPDGKTLASCSDDGTVKLWDVVERKERETLAGHTATVFSVAFSPDGQILASGGGDNTVKLWYLGKNREPESLPTDAPAVSVAFSPGGETLACASGNAVRFWRTVDVQESDQLDRRWDLQRRARAIVEAGPQEQRRVLADVRNHLGAIAAKELTLRDVILGTATAWRLENGGHAELAEEAFQSFAEALATSGKPKAHRLADRWEAKLRERRDRLRADEHLKKANEFVVAGEPSKAIEELSLAVELKPNSLLILRKRGQLYARLGQWEKASVDYARIVALMPSRDFTWLQAAPLFVLADDLEGYREHCRAMLARFGQSDEAQAAERTSKACLLLPGPVEALQPSLNALQNALQDGSAPGWLRKWGFLTLALAAHRAGDAEKTIECIDQVRQSPDYRPAGPEKAISLCLEAMSLQRLEETGKAGQTLADANNLTSDYFARLAAGEVSVEHDWLIAEVLRREATKSISRPAEHPDSDTNKAPKHQEHSDRKSLDRFESGMRRPGWQHQITIIHTIVSEAPESATGNARVVHTFGRVPVKVHVGDAGVFC